MVAGHLRERGGYYHIVLSYTDENGQRKTPSKATGLPVKGNKKRAEAMLQKARMEKEAELQLLLEEKKQRCEEKPSEIPFTTFLSDWLDMMQSSVEEVTHAAYSMTIRRKVIPYFDTEHPA